MSNARPSADAFVSVETVHRGEVRWCWTDEKLHDTDYHIKVECSLSKKITELEKKHNVQQDRRYCCQGEGTLLEGENRESVEAAVLELARHLARFTGVQPL